MVGVPAPLVTVARDVTDSPRVIDPLLGVEVVDVGAGRTSTHAALEAALSWIEESRRTWSDRMDRLETHLAGLQEREDQ